MSTEIKIFVSGKWSDKKLIKEKMIYLIKLGHKITHDWTIFWTNKRNIENKEDLKEAAVLDINGVKECDIHIIIISDPDYIYRGTFTELGCSLALNKKILIYCPYEKAFCMSNPFYFHPNVIHFSDWIELIKNI